MRHTRRIGFSQAPSFHGRGFCIPCRMSQAGLCLHTGGYAFGLPCCGGTRLWFGMRVECAVPGNGFGFGLAIGVTVVLPGQVRMCEAFRIGAMLPAQSGVWQGSRVSGANACLDGRFGERSGAVSKSQYDKMMYKYAFMCSLVAVEYQEYMAFNLHGGITRCRKNTL